MPITVDSAYLDHVIDVLTTQIAGEVLASPGGPIDNLVLKAGYAISSGEAIEAQGKTRGTDVHNVLQEIGTLASTRANQLRAYILMTDKAEEFAGMSAADLGQRLPNWVTGGGSA